jgi:hypothetical protein
LPSAHSLVNLHVFDGAVHAPALHVRPPEQSDAVLHGQGPADPPQAWQTFATHTLPPVQSFVVVHSFVGGGVELGEVQMPDLQTVPFGHVESSEHVVAQVPPAHTCPPEQLVVPVQGCVSGGATFWQPYASQL